MHREDAEEHREEEEARSRWQVACRGVQPNARKWQVANEPANLQLRMALFSKTPLFSD